MRRNRLFYCVSLTIYIFISIIHMNMKVTALCFITILNCSSQTGTSVIGEHDEYTVTNKESNQVDFFPPGVLREILGDRIQPTNGKHVKTQRRLRRSLTPEEKAKLMMVDIGTSGCSGFACSDGKAVLEGPKVFMPKLTVIKPPPATNLGDNVTTTVETLAVTVAEKQTVIHRNLTEKNAIENQTPIVTKSTILNSAENQTTVLTQTSSTAILLNDTRTNLTISTTSPRPLLEQITQTSMNELYSKPPHIILLTTRNYRRFFLPSEPIVVFRLPFYSRHRIKSFLGLPKSKRLSSRKTMLLPPMLRFRLRHPWLNPRRFLRLSTRNRLQTKMKLKQMQPKGSIEKLSQTSHRENQQEHIASSR